MADQASGPRLGFRELRAELAHLTAWSLEKGHRVLRYSHGFRDPAVAASMALVSLLLGLRHGVLPGLDLDGAHLVLTLTDRQAGGVTSRHLALARELDTWLAAASRLPASAGRP